MYAPVSVLTLIFSPSLTKRGTPRDKRIPLLFRHSKDPQKCCKACLPHGKKYSFGNCPFTQIRYQPLHFALLLRKTRSFMAMTRNIRIPLGTRIECNRSFELPLKLLRFHTLNA